MNISLALLQLLASTAQEYDIYREQLSVIDALISHTAAQKEVHTIAYFGRIDDLAPYITAASGTPKVVITQSFGDINFSKVSDFNRNSFFIAIGSVEQKAWWNRLSNAFADAQGYARGVFLIPKYVMRPEVNIHEHFEWCWQNGFASVLILVEMPDIAEPFHIYSYDRFPKMLVHREVWQPTADYFYNKFSNLHGYRLRSPALYDPPRVFAWQDPRSQKIRLRGYAARMFQAFIKQNNGGLEIVLLNNSSPNTILDIIQQLNKGEIDVSMNSYMPYNGVRVSYPIRMMPWCILVPSSDEISAYEYFLRPFQVPTWYTCIAGLLYLTLLKGLSVCILKRNSTAWPDFGRAFLEVLRHMLFLPTPIRRLGWHHATCFLQAMALGFILSSLYLASLTSFLLSIIFEEQLDTLTEMVHRNLSIHVIEYEIPMILNSRGLPKGFGDLLVPRDVKQLMQEIIDMQQGRAYISQEDFTLFALLQQRHMLRSVFHVAKECITTIPVGFLMPTHSQFEAMLNHFILRAAASGLTSKWFEDSWTDGLRAGILHIRKDSEMSTRALSVEYFDFAWMVIRNGNFCGMVCFLLENLHRITRRFKVSVTYY